MTSAAVGDLIIKAREIDAELLWLHSNLDLTAHGFERFPGYVRMHAEQPPQGMPLRRLEPEYYASTLDGSYRGLWGHKLVRDPQPPPKSDRPRFVWRERRADRTLHRRSSRTARGRAGRPP